MAAKKKPQADSMITLPPIDVQRIEITIVGDSPLICHRWSEKARRAMLDKQMRRAQGPKEAKSPEADFEASLYPHPAGGYGFPAIAVKSAAISACRFVEGVTMVLARGAMHIDDELVKIDGEPNPREDMVRVGMGTADIRFRGEFKQWRTSFEVAYNAGVLSAEQLVNLLNTAGFGVGIGEWRPEKGGSYGRFHVATSEDIPS